VIVKGSTYRQTIEFQNLHFLLHL